MPLRIVDDLPPLGALVVIGHTGPPLGEKPFDQLGRLGSSRTSDGPFGVGHGATPAPSMSAGCRLVAPFSRRQPLRTMTMSKVVEAVLGDLHERFPATPTDPNYMTADTRCRSFGSDRRSTITNPQRTRVPYTEPKEWLLHVGVLWDFPGTSGRISQYEREATERAFMQVNDLRRPDIAVTALAGLFRDK